MDIRIFAILLMKLFLVTSFPDEKKDENQRIVLGKKIDITEVPWQVSFLRVVKLLYPYYEYFCGGAIIGPREVLTAAHCVHMLNVSNIRIRAGSSSINEGGNIHTVELVQIYPKYLCTSSKMEHDLAFVRVRERFHFSIYIQPIKISVRNPQNGEKVKVSGWGKTKPGFVFPPVDLPKNLQCAMLRVWDKNECYKDFENEEILQFSDDFYCINNFKFGTKEAICQGDSGSPVVLNDQLVGVTSLAAQKTEEGDVPLIPPDTPCHMIKPGLLYILQLAKLVCNGPTTTGGYYSVVNHRKWIIEMLKESLETSEKN